MEEGCQEEEKEWMYQERQRGDKTAKRKDWSGPGVPLFSALPELVLEVSLDS